MVSLSVWTCPFEGRNDWRNPDGVKPHVLDVIQFVYDALVVSPTVLAILRVASWPRPIRKCKPVSDKLVTLA